LRVEAPSNLMAEESRLADTELVERCLNGDLGAFEDLYRQHSTRLYNLAFRMVGNAADAEDLLQDIFLTVYRKLESFRGASALGTWLYRLGMNVCLDRLRSKAARQDQATDTLDERLSGAQVTGTLTGVSRIDLERAIASLPEGSRAAFLLHDVEGFDHTEVGRLLGVAEGTSKSQVHKARLRIREFLHQPAPKDQRPAPPRLVDVKAEAAKSPGTNAKVTKTRQ
jgi:RNA polymerase sigma-70 factor (ECF subfamily)